MTGNVESSDADDLPPLPGFGSDDKADAAGLPGDAAEPGISPPASFGGGDIYPNADDEEDIEPAIAPPKTESKVKSAVQSGTGSQKKDEFLGRTFGGYELVETIGHGGMGTVYKGRQVSLDRTVAVKLLLPALVNNEEFIRRFEREAKCIARLSHPNIVGVLDFGVSEDGVYFMVIEYVQGTSLSAIISDKLMMGFEEYLPILSQCLAGLDHVSRHGVIHRDIKPDNILVDETGVAKLADFGLAKDVSGDSNDTDLTAVGSAMGTPAYMSPEQCMGRPLDVRSDVYALGVTTYLALTGEKPFKGNSGFEVMTKQREYVPPAPSELNPQVNKKVSDLVMQMLAKKPQDRFKDADDCRQAWLTLGEELGILIPKNMRSGEWHAHDGMSDPSIPAPVDPSVPNAPADVPAPMTLDSEDPFSHADKNEAMPPIVPSERHGASSQSVARRNGTAPVAAPPPLPPGVGAPPASPAPTMPGAGANPPPAPPAPPSPPQAPGVSSDFRRTHSDSFDASDSRICSQCGAQSRLQYSRCQNCGYDFSQDNTGSLEDQIKQADTMVSQGKLKEAMSLYNKLADQTDDRKLRSVIRSKERGARKSHEDKIYHRVSQQTDDLVSKGEIKASIELLEREMTSSDSSELSSRLKSQATEIRQRLKKKKRRIRNIIIFLIILLGLAVAAVVYRGHVPFLQKFLDPYVEQYFGSTSESTSDNAEVEALPETEGESAGDSE